MVLFDLIKREISSWSETRQKGEELQKIVDRMVRSSGLDKSTGRQLEYQVEYKACGEDNYFSSVDNKICQITACKENFYKKPIPGSSFQPITEDEVAFSLGHEIAHCFFAHSEMKSLLRRSLGIYLNSNRAVANTDSEGVEGYCEFSRELEEEADVISMSLMLAAGYNTSIVPEYFDNEGEVDLNPGKYDTHPTAQYRANNARNLLSLL